MRRVYLDYAATTPADPEVIRAMLPYFDTVFGNASSIHTAGLEAKAAVEQARETIASFIGANPEEIIFTSGGTESNNHALKGAAYFMRARGRHIITSPVEHPSVSKPCRFLEKEGFAVTYLPVDRYGMVDPDDVRKSITSQTILISIMHANNEIGTIEPIEDIAGIARQHGIVMHTDAVQTFAHLPFTVDSLGIDMLSVSGHKLYGPKGVGFLYARKGTRLVPFMQGGSQERGRRASTYNVPGIVGLAKAVELAKERMEGEMQSSIKLRDRLIKGITESIDDIVLNGHPVKRLPNNVSVTIRNVKDELMLMELDGAGIFCSMGAACKASVPRGLQASKGAGMGGDERSEFLRLSVGRFTTEEDIDYTIDVLARTVKELRAM